jgi:membrane protease YdiL (CAAX protease family)
MLPKKLNQKSKHADNSLSYYSLLIPYIGPYFAYVVIASLFDAVSPLWNYSIRMAAVSILLLWFWRWYAPLTGPKRTPVSVLYGMIFGIFGTILWILMLKPFAAEGAKSWGTSEIIIRLMASSLLVPIFEELLMRVYIFRLSYQWRVERKKNKNAFENALQNKNINNFEPGAWNAAAILVSTLAFALGHRINEFPAAALYGLLMIFLWIKRKDVISCMVAHGTTNLTLGIYVGLTRQWQLW